MEALNSSYEWGINRDNAKNLSAQQLAGLASLAPRAGVGLDMNPARTPLSFKFPTAQFAPDAASHFGFLQDVGYAGGPTQSLKVNANVDAGVASGTEKPYFDPYYPNESMLALKNWLAPQVGKGADAAMHARGLDYTGLAPAGRAGALNYLEQLTPMGQTGQQAAADDFARLYGTNITNSLIEGRAGSNGGGQYGVRIPPVPPSIPGATPYAGGDTNALATLPVNPNFHESAPSGSIGIPEAPGFGPPTPLFGLYEGSTGNAYASPGYLYDPNHAPDTSKMPWLAPATPYSGA